MKTAKVYISTDGGANFTEIANLEQSQSGGEINWATGFANIEDYAEQESSHSFWI